MTLGEFFVGKMIGFIIILIIVCGFFVIKNIKEVTVPNVDVGLKKYSSSDYGVSFFYPSEYILTELDVPGSEMRKHHIITLVNKKDLPAPDGGEGPTAISVDIYQNNLDKQTTEGWIRNSSISNFKLSGGNLASTTLGGMEALSYRWSGLYEGTTVVTSNPNWVYAFTVTYLEIGAPIIQDFVKLKEGLKINSK